MLILSLSGRALAQAAVRSGHAVEVLDCFADIDTRACAQRLWQCAGDAIGFEPGALRKRIRELRRYSKARVVVPGSGLERCPGVLSVLGRDWHVLGNSVACIREYQDWRRFFALLDRLAVAHPPVATLLPGAGWLRKSGHGAGGWGVRHAEASLPLLGADEYYQRWQDGRVMSVVFLADGRDASVVGYNEQIQQPVADCPCIYAGAVSLPSAAHDWARVVAHWVGQLTAVTGLRGLCGLDFILDRQGQPWLLEVNPRPPASFELHERPGTDLFTAHIQACEGQLASLPSGPGPCRAHAVLYALQAVTIPADFSWPEWASDLPVPGTIIRPGQPVCGIRAEAEAAAEAMAQALQRRRTMEFALCRQSFASLTT